MMLRSKLVAKAQNKRPLVSIKARVKIFRNILDWFYHGMRSAEHAIQCACHAIEFNDSEILLQKLRNTYPEDFDEDLDSDATWDNAPPEKITKWLDHELRK